MRYLFFQNHHSLHNCPKPFPPLLLRRMYTSIFETPGPSKVQSKPRTAHTGSTAGHASPAHPRHTCRRWHAYCGYAAATPAPLAFAIPRKWQAGPGFGVYEWGEQKVRKWQLRPQYIAPHLGLWDRKGKQRKRGSVAAGLHDSGG